MMGHDIVREGRIPPTTGDGRRRALDHRCITVAHRDSAQNSPGFERVIMHAEQLEKLETELRELTEKKEALEAELAPINQRIERIKIEIRYLGVAADHQII